MSFLVRGQVQKADACPANGEIAMIWFGGGVNPQVVDDLYGVETVDELDVRMVCLPFCGKVCLASRSANSDQNPVCPDNELMLLPDPITETAHPPFHPAPERAHPPRADRQPLSAYHHGKTWTAWRSSMRIIWWRTPTTTHSAIRTVNFSYH